MSPFAEMSAEVDALAGRWAEQRAERQARRSLEAADFVAIADTGFLRAMVPVGIAVSLR